MAPTVGKEDVLELAASDDLGFLGSRARPHHITHCRADLVGNVECGEISGAPEAGALHGVTASGCDPLALLIRKQ